MKKLFTSVSLLCLSLAAHNAIAKVSPEEAEKLGTSLTPLGAEMVGNAAGTIPAWTDGQNSKNATPSKDPGRPDNPFASDKVLFEITNANLSTYQDNLSPGQIAMFNKYPGYKMPVYPTRRSAAYPENLYGVIKKNAVTAELVQGGNGLTPKPQNPTKIQF